MKNIFVKALLTWLILPGVAMAGNILSGITNGTSASLSSYPDFLSIGIDSADYGGYTYVGELCGATKLSDDYVLTAAHCLFDDYGNFDLAYVMYYVVGQTDSESVFPAGVTTKRVAAVYYYSSFSDSSSDLWANDIAILKLEDDGLTDVGSNVSYLNSDTYRDAGNSFVAVGLGMTSSTTYSSTLMQTSLTYVDNDTCRNSGDGLSLINDNQLCFTGSSTDSSGLSNGVCSGDSGGPVYWNEDGTYYQVGITSFGPSECGEGLGEAEITGVFTEVSAYYDWIESVLNDDIDDSVTTTCSFDDTEREDYYSGESVTACGVTVSLSSDSSSSTGYTSHRNEELSTGSSSSSGGGAIPIPVLLSLCGLLWLRRRTSVH